jgi:RNA polymerase sigma factor (sigma-70 family)
MDDIPIAELVAAAAAGDESAWDEIVNRFSPLLAGVIGGYRLPPAVRQDIAQIVWLRLVEKLDTLRDPQCLPGWLVTTARHEALRQIEQLSRTQARDPLDAYWVDQADVVVLRQERHEALLGALAELPAHQRQLLQLLIADPPLSYATIASRLGISIGNIGPTRARALDRLRQSSALQALLEGPFEPAKGWGK